MSKNNMVSQFKYVIWTRYEYFGKNGIQFTKWFRQSTVFYNTEAEAKDALKTIKERVKGVDKASKRKHEFEIRYLDVTLLPCTKPHRPKGRPKKIENKVLIDLVKKLVKSKDGEVLVPEEIGVYLYNDTNLQDIVNTEVAKKITDKWVRYWHDGYKNVYMLLKNNGDNEIWE